MCQVSQPALTRVPKAEDELGGLLFSRGPSNIHTAELGSLIEPHSATAWYRPVCRRFSATSQIGDAFTRGVDPGEQSVAPRLGRRLALG